MTEKVVPEVRVSHVGQLIDFVIDAPDLLQSAPIWFRGQRDAGWDLEPGVWRAARANGVVAVDEYEQNLVHRFRNRAGLYGQNLKFDERANWLQLMQHHRLPTRLLDWSRSPLVAAYFATESASELSLQDEIKSDAAIWALAPHTLNDRATGGVYSITPSIESGICAGLVDGAFWGDRRSMAGTAWRNTRAVARHDLEEAPRSRASCMAVMANETSLRMLMQQGAFTVHSVGGIPLNRDPDVSSCLLKIVVPAEAVMSFAKQIQACGFDEAGTYPDLDHLASELVRAGASVGQ